MAADFDDGFRFIRTGYEEEALRCWIESAENNSDMQLFLGDYFYFAKSDFDMAVFWWILIAILLKKTVFLHVKKRY